MLVQLIAMIFLIITKPVTHSDVSQSKDCKKLVADLKKGTVNGLPPTATMAEVKSKLPCFTGDTEEGTLTNCGGGVYFLNHDIFFYTGHDFIDIRKNFKGKVTPETLNMPWETVKKRMGEPTRQQFDEEPYYVFYDTDYGCLVFKIQYSLVMQIGIHAQKANQVELCL